MSVIVTAGKLTCRMLSTTVTVGTRRTHAHRVLVAATADMKSLPICEIMILRGGENNGHSNCNVTAACC